MMIEELKSKLPRRKKSVKSFFKSCFSRKLFIKAENSESILHLEKAKHDLQRAIKEFEDDCFDWTIIKSYYAIHHAANALLVKKQEMFSKDHICLIIALRNFNLISDGFYQELRNMYSKFSDFAAFEITYFLRKISQYDVVKWKKITKDEAGIVLSFAKKFVAFVEGEIV